LGVLDKALIVEILLDSVAHSVVVEEKFTLQFGNLLLIPLDHSLVKPISLWQDIIRHAFLVLDHFSLLDLVHDAHLKLLLKALHPVFLLPKLDTFYGLPLTSHFLVEVKLVFFPLLRF
jgi:hypothetical protein